MSLLVDPGSVGNLGGDAWVRCLASEGKKHGHMPKQTKRDRPLRVAGVGHGSQSAEYDCELPICLQQTTGIITSGTFTAPTIPNSDLPGLLGLDSLESLKCIIDFGTRKLYIPGPGDVSLGQAMSPGTDVSQLLKASSGHLLLPCSHFGQHGEHQKESENTVSLLASNDATPS